MKRLRVIAGMAFLVVFLFLGRALSAQSNGLVFELNVGKAGSVSELIYAPLQGKETKDPSWVYDRFPDGTENPRFPPVQAPFQLPVQVGFPNVLVDMAQIFRPGVDQTLTHPTGSDSDNTSQEVLQSGVTVQIEAKLPWVKTGFLVKAGQPYYILASGRWSNHFDEMWCGPEGHPALPAGEPRPGHLPMPCSTACSGMLVGRIGVGGTGFAIGTGGAFTASRDGEVHLMCNDCLDGPEGYTQGSICFFCQNNGITNEHMANNRGSLTVTLSLNPLQ